MIFSNKNLFHQRNVTPMTRFYLRFYLLIYVEISAYLSTKISLSQKNSSHASQFTKGRTGNDFSHTPFISYAQARLRLQIVPLSRISGGLLCIRDGPSSRNMYICSKSQPDKFWSFCESNYFNLVLKKVTKCHPPQPPPPLVII